jgi:hypothetical protein
MVLDVSNFYLVQDAFIGFLCSGAISAVLAHILEGFVEPIAGRLLIPVLPAAGAIAAFYMCAQAYGGLRNATRALAGGRHGEEDRKRILSDILLCSGLQALAAGAGVSLSLHFAALSAPTTVSGARRTSYVYTYNLSLALVFAVFLLVSLAFTLSRLLTRKRKQD